MLFVVVVVVVVVFGLVGWSVRQSVCWSVGCHRRRRRRSSYFSPKAIFLATSIWKIFFRNAFQVLLLLLLLGQSVSRSVDPSAGPSASPSFGLSVGPSVGPLVCLLSSSFLIIFFSESNLFGIFDLEDLFPKCFPSVVVVVG